MVISGGGHLQSTYGANKKKNFVDFYPKKQTFPRQFHGGRCPAYDEELMQNNAWCLFLQMGIP